MAVLGKCCGDSPEQQYKPLCPGAGCSEGNTKDRTSNEGEEKNFLKMGEIIACLYIDRQFSRKRKTMGQEIKWIMKSVGEWPQLINHPSWLSSGHGCGEEGDVGGRAGPLCEANSLCEGDAVNTGG